MLIKSEYNATASFLYAAKWAHLRNPKYYDFENLGGDCTNFVSQCVFAGAQVMNYTPIYGWYYTSLNSRTASWSGVEYFYNFMTQNRGEGPVMHEVDVSEIRIGDVVQLGDSTGRFYHAALVVATGLFPTANNISVAAHTYDTFMCKLNAYEYDVARFLHVDGVNITI